MIQTLHPSRLLWQRWLGLFGLAVVSVLLILTQRVMVVLGNEAPTADRLQSAILTVCQIDTSTPGDEEGGDSPVASRLYEEMFNGEFMSPYPFSSPDWEVTFASSAKDGQFITEPLVADNGQDCTVSPGTHTVSMVDDAVYLCHDQLMTVAGGRGYKAIYLMPDRLLDFSEGEAVMRFSLSTIRLSPQERVDIWISPLEQQIQLARDDSFASLPAMLPQQAIHLRMQDSNGHTAFRVSVIKDGNEIELPHAKEWQPYDNVLTPDVARLDTFELRLSRNSIRFGLPDYALWWVNTPLDDLGWDKGAVQLVHQSYNPNGCGSQCHPTTWHWDELTLDPAKPFTLIKADPRMLSLQANPQGLIHFSAPAPHNSVLRFVATGEHLQVSLDGGRSWQDAASRMTPQAGQMNAYILPVPEGTDNAMFQGNAGDAGVVVTDMSIVSSVDPVEELERKNAPIWPFSLFSAK